MYSCMAVASMTSTIIFRSIEPYLGYTGMFVLSSGVSSCALVLNLLFKEKSKFDYI